MTSNENQLTPEQKAQAAKNLKFASAFGFIAGGVLLLVSIVLFIVGAFAQTEVDALGEKHMVLGEVVSYNPETNEATYVSLYEHVYEGKFVAEVVDGKTSVGDRSYVYEVESGDFIPSDVVGEIMYRVGAGFGLGSILLFAVSILLIYGFWGRHNLKKLLV